MNESESTVRLVSAQEIEPNQLLTLLAQAYGPARARFYVEHGDWLYRGRDTRIVALCEGVAAGYRAMVPTMCFFEGRELPGVWAMHLYVAPAFRGRGLQRLLDQQLLDAAGLRMSFPNELGAKIYVKQGYGLRQDVKRQVALLRPEVVLRTKDASGKARIREDIRVFKHSPIAAAVRGVAARYRPRATDTTDSLTPSDLETIFRRHVTGELATTSRTAEFLQWRYLEAPYLSELRFYLTGPADKPTHYAVVRYVPYRHSERVRVLDIFGNFGNTDGLLDLMRTIVRDAAIRGAALVETLAPYRPLARAARSAGLLVADAGRFRWLADDQAVHERFRTVPLHWTFGDAENDTPPSHSVPGEPTRQEEGD